MWILIMFSLRWSTAKTYNFNVSTVSSNLTTIAEDHHGKSNTENTITAKMLG